MASQQKNPPRHVAIIMDGNGRWGTNSGLKRTDGHEKGAKNLEKISKILAELGVQELTVYAFSMLNWGRSPVEVWFIMNRILSILREKTPEFVSRDVRVCFIGNRTDGRLPDNLLVEMDRVEEATAGCRAQILRIALNYDGVDEVNRAAQKMAADGGSDIRDYLDTAGHPDPDLVIRTGVNNPVPGVWRDSGFLLLQTTQSVKVSLPVLWPDFDSEHLMLALMAWYAEDKLLGGQRQLVAAE